MDDGSCILGGCMDSVNPSYNPHASFDDGSCLFLIFGCADSVSLTFRAATNVHNPLTCVYKGCTDSTNPVYEQQAAYEDGSWGRYDGDHGQRLIELLASLHAVEHVSLCASGTIAVELALRGLQVGADDEVRLIVQSAELSFEPQLLHVPIANSRCASHLRRNC